MMMDVRVGLTASADLAFGMNTPPDHAGKSGRGHQPPEHGQGGKL